MRDCSGVKTQLGGNGGATQVTDKRQPEEGSERGGSGADNERAENAQSSAVQLDSRYSTVQTK